MCSFITSLTNTYQQNTDITRSNVGTIYEKLEKYDEAINDFSTAISLSPNSPSSINSRGLTYEKQGRLDEAVQDFSRAIELDPQNAIFLHNRGLVLRNMGKYENAVRSSSSSSVRASISNLRVSQHITHEFKNIVSLTSSRIS